jgi:hypothetical protein
VAAVAQRMTGQFIRLGTPQIVRGGSIKVDAIEFKPVDGEAVIWTDMSMERSVADLLHAGVSGTVYLSKRWSTIYGLCIAGGTSRFESSYANLLMLLMSIGMLFGGLATSMFLLPILVALAGLVGVLMCVDARSARRQFRRDSRANIPPATGSRERP